jgi:hypothetical protein
MDAARSAATVSLRWVGGFSGSLWTPSVISSPPSTSVPNSEMPIAAKSLQNSVPAARAIADEDEKRAALTGMIERFFPGRAATLRPIDERELRATMVIAMPIDAASAKVRAAGVGGDEADLGVATWAGVLPIHTVVGVAEPCPRGSVTVERPAGLDAYRAGRRLDEALLETEARWEAAPKGDAAEP